MKGIVFTEFLEMVESAHGMDTTDKLHELPELASGGVYTSVGTYEAAELLAMVDRLSELTGTPVDDLLDGFGRQLFGRFYVLFPAMFDGVTCAKDFLAKIEGHIHVEVRKLYPDAELPTFKYRVEEGALVISYESVRPLAKFANGLIQGCLNHFAGNESLSCEILEPGDGTRAEFTVR